MELKTDLILRKKTYFIFVIFLFLSCQITHENHDFSSFVSNEIHEPKHRGAHVFGIESGTDLEFLHRSNIDWVTIVPWGFQDDIDSPEVTHHNGDSLQIRSMDSTYLADLKYIRSKGFKTFVKPHVWILSPKKDTWRSDVFPKNEEDWQTWQNTYRDFILRFARVAEEAEADMFCIGTEFTKLAIEKPEYWRTLTSDIRAVFSGKLTYAANWYREYEKISFWDELDFIGVQAYFPLAKSDFPDTEQISEGWEKYLSNLASVQKKYDKKVLFTEMGYKSTADTATEPWVWIENLSEDDRSPSQQTQANCYESFFKKVWPNSWFAGVHIWQLRPEYEDENFGDSSRDFTPQRKMAQKIITEGFRR